MRGLPAVAGTVENERVPALLLAIGGCYGLAMAVEVAVTASLDWSELTRSPFLVGLVCTVPVAVGLVYGGRWLERSNVEPERYPRILGWCLGGLLGFLALNAAIAAARADYAWYQVFSWLRWASALGAGVGLLIGTVEARAIERSIQAERAAMRSEHLAEQRDILDYLNSVLRHEILNTATAIGGYATRLEDDADLDAESERWVAIIADEAEDMARVIDDVRVLLQRRAGDHDLERVDVGRVLEAEVCDLTYRWDGVEVETSIPEDVAVRADDLLPRVFGNLLANAVEHNDSETPRIAVTVEPAEDVVAVEVADDGPGIPDDEVDSLFERGSARQDTHGLGLYLVDELVGSYCGSVELVETGPEGTRFRVELPRADAPASTETDVAVA